MIEHLASWPARRPWRALLLAVVALSLSIAGIVRLSADASVQSMFPSNDPAAGAMVNVLNHFSAADDLLILVTLKSSQPNDPIPLLDFAQRLGNAIHQSPQASLLVDAVVYRADAQSKEFFEKIVAPTGMYYLSDDSFNAALGRLSKTEMTRQIRQNEAMISAPGPAAGALSKALLQDPLHLHEFLVQEMNTRLPFKSAGNGDSFLSPDGRSLLIRVLGKRSLSDIEFAKSLTLSISSIAAQANTDGLPLDISGGYAIASASERSIRHDMIISVVSSVLFLQGLFVIAYRRSVRYFLLAFLPVALGITYGFGVRSLLSSTISPAVAVVGAVLAGLGIDYTVLYLPHFHRAHASGAGVIDATKQTTMTLGSTLFAACVTSVIGFLAIGWSSVPALRDFSRVGSMGLIGALLATLLVLPSLLTLTDRGANRPAGPRVDLSPLLRWIAQHRRGSITFVLMILAAALAALVLVPGQLFPPETDLTIMHPRPNPPLEAETTIAQRMGYDPGLLVVYLHADSPDALLQMAAKVRQRLSAPSLHSVGVSGTFGLASLLPDPDVVKSRASMITPAQADRIVADFRSVVADSSFSQSAYEPYSQFLKRLLSSPPAPNVADLTAYPRLADTMLSRDELHESNGKNWEAITTIFLDRPLNDRRSRLAAVDAIRSAIKDFPGATLTGLGVIGLDTEETISHDLPRLLLLASVLVTVYLLVQFRSARSALLAMVPAVFSLIFLLAFMRLFGQKFNLVNLIALPLLVGIDVDYGIFLVSLAGKNTEKDGVPPGIAVSAHSVMVSAAANVLGFGSLITTSVPAIRSLGWAVGVGVASCFAATMFLLAPMLMREN
jgi:uncharacterized protein